MNTVLVPVMVLLPLATVIVPVPAVNPTFTVKSVLLVAALISLTFNGD